MKTALFDFDSVVVDTEPIYDIFWNAAAEKYKVDIDNFAHVIKGTTLPFIMEKYFSDFPQALRQQIQNESIAYEKDMPIPPTPGSLEFIRMLKVKGVRLGLVTSSEEAKVMRAFRPLSLDGLFDTLVTADRITRSKPDPMCYLPAASDLQVAPEDCLVFEDSFAGIGAATRAGMRVIGIRVIEIRVIGLSTTNPAEALKGKVYKVIPDFRKVTIEDYAGW